MPPSIARHGEKRRHDPAGRRAPARQPGLAGDDGTRHAAPDRQRPPRSRLALAVAGGLPGGQGDLPLGARPAGRVGRFPLHLEFGRALRVDRGQRPGDVRRDQGARRRGALVHRRRLVGAGGLQPAGRRIARPAGALRAALLQGEARRHRDRRLQRRQLRAQRDAAADPARVRHGRLRLHAPRAAREGPAGPALLVGGGRRLAGAGLPHPLRVLHAGRADRGARPPLRAGAAPAARRSDMLLRRRQPRRRPDAGEHRLHPRAAPTPRCPRSPSARRAASSRPSGRAMSRCRPSTTTCSTTPAAATRRTRASSAGTGGRSRPC